MSRRTRAALLPLLQVTLEDLWRRGRLTLASYGDLTDALRERADAVMDYTDYDGRAVTSAYLDQLGF